MSRALLVVLPALLALALAAPRVLPAQSFGADAESRDTSHAAIVRRAEGASRNGRWLEASELWHWAVAADDRTPDHWWKLGVALFNASRHRESIAAYERALQLGAGDPATGAWQIARAYARRGDRTQALRWLEHATALGFDARAAVRQEPSFEEYLGDPRLARAADPRAERGLLRRSPAGRTGHPSIRKIEPARLPAARAFHAGAQAVRAGATIDDPLRKVVGEILEPHLVAR